MALEQTKQLLWSMPMTVGRIKKVNKQRQSQKWRGRFPSISRHFRIRLRVKEKRGLYKPRVATEWGDGKMVASDVGGRGQYKDNYYSGGNVGRSKGKIVVLSVATSAAMHNVLR
jgi:hypothetical protein